MGAVMSFNTIVEKVDYIEKNFTELKPVLLNDDALASMLIDMMRDKKFGKSHQLERYSSYLTLIPMMPLVMRRLGVERGDELNKRNQFVYIVRTRNRTLIFCAV